MENNIQDAVVDSANIYQIESHVSPNYMTKEAMEAKPGSSIGFGTYPNSDMPCIAVVKDEFGSQAQYLLANIVDTTVGNIKYTIGTQNLTFQTSPKENVLMPGITDTQLLMLL